MGSAGDGGSRSPRMVDATASRMWLIGLGLRDPDAADRTLRRIAALGAAQGDFDRLIDQLDRALEGCPDPGMALVNLERYLAASPAPATALAALARGPATTAALFQLFSTSQFFSDVLIGDPAIVDWLRAGPGRPDRSALIDELRDELRRAGDARAAAVLRRFRRRQMLRIGYHDIVRGLPVELVAEDLSILAEACVEGAYGVARARAVARHGEARGPDGRPARFVVLAFGKLGGAELNYSSDIDLMFVYESEGQTDGPRPMTHAEFFARLGGEIVRLLSDHNELGQAYRVDMRLRPEGAQGPLARSLAASIAYYESAGRTWERQALIKCRPVAGDLTLGHQFLDALAPFVYRRYLSAAEIVEIKAMKRRIERRTTSAGDDEHEVKTGRGGIRDVEFVVQFLQLLHGGQDPRVRHTSTLAAIDRLRALGCLSAEERGTLAETYKFLRRVEHRLQILFDRQTHQLPRDPEELRRLALRLGYRPATPWEDPRGPAERFGGDYRALTDRNRRILDHLLHEAFADAPDEAADPVVDLVLDPEPPADRRREVLGRFAFRDPEATYRRLTALAREDSPFLSQPRCRHEFAAVAPALLRAVGETRDPDATLTSLERVSASLGAKSILWELLRTHPPSLRLYVALCAESPLLSEILVGNPGMIDDLVDSLVADRLRTGAELRAELAELCRGAEDLGPILLGFRNAEWLRIGARDLLGRDPVRRLTRALADVAGAVVEQVARAELARLRASGAWYGPAPRWAIVGLGRLGARAMSYHSDLDLIFVHDGDIAGGDLVPTLARRVIRALEGGPAGPTLYPVDTRLRPHGSSGPLAVPLPAFRDYFAGAARPWERLALARARVVHATGDFGREVAASLRGVLAAPGDAETLARQLVAQRRQLAEAHAPDDLKHAPGGIADVEFLVGFLQLAHADAHPEVLRPNVWTALDRLRRLGALDPEDDARLRAAYDALRAAESRLRLRREGVGGLAAPGRGDDPADRAGVALEPQRAAVRALFDRIVAGHAGEARQLLEMAREGPR
jgi:glutamate-ammonia-ligase adenylyltransferase